MDLVKPWADEYIDLKYKFKNDDDLFDELVERYPNLGKHTVDGKFICPTCPPVKDDDGNIVGNMGRYLTDGDSWQHCDCERQWKMYYWYSAANIAEGHQRMDWDEWGGDEQARLAVWDWLENHSGFIKNGMGFFMYGPPGTGKTMLTVLAAKELVKLGYDVRFMLYADLISAYTKGWKDYDARDRFEQDIIRADILLLDDVGKEVASGKTLSIGTFDIVLRSRSHANRPTFITTNFDSPQEFERNYQSGIASLLTEKAAYIHVAGKDYREDSRQRNVERAKKGWIRPIV